MALPNTLDTTNDTTPAIVALQIYPGDLKCRIQIRRAPEDGASPGNPLVASASILTTLSPQGAFNYIDRWGGISEDFITLGSGPYFYQIRHTRPGYLPSDWFPTGWLEAYPTIKPEQYLPVPSPYPNVTMIVRDSAVKYGQVEPINVLVGFSASPTHPDLNIYYDYIPASASVPRPSLDAGSDWQLIGPSGSTNLVKDSTDSWLVAAFAEINGIIGPVSTAEVTPDLTPSVTNFSFSQTGDGSLTQSCVTGKILTADAQVERARVYRSNNWWPTMDKSPSGSLSSSYFKGEVAIPYLNYTECGYKTNDVVYDIWVPLDANGREGAAVSGTVTVSGTPQTQPAISLFTVEDSSTGTGCGDQDQHLLQWSTRGVSDGSHDMKIYRKITPEETSFSLVSTEVSPASNQSATLDAGLWSSSGKYDPFLVVVWRLELVDTGLNVDDAEEQSNAVGRATYCEV